MARRHSGRVLARPTRHLPTLCRWPKELHRKTVGHHKLSVTSQVADPYCRIAYMEMRVLMAKMLYNFSFEMADPNEDWASTKKAYSAWNNSGLRLRLKPLEH